MFNTLLFIRILAIEIETRQDIELTSTPINNLVLISVISTVNKRRENIAVTLNQAVLERMLKVYKES